MDRVYAICGFSRGSLLLNIPRLENQLKFMTVNIILVYLSRCRLRKYWIGASQISVPVCTWSPIFNSDIVTDFPFSRFTSPVEGKQLGGGGGGVVVVVVVVVYVERNSVIDIWRQQYAPWHRDPHLVPQSKELPLEFPTLQRWVGPSFQQER